METLPTMQRLQVPIPAARNVIEEAKAAMLSGLPVDPGEASQRLALMANSAANSLAGTCEPLKRTQTSAGTCARP